MFLAAVGNEVLVFLQLSIVISQKLSIVSPLFVIVNIGSDVEATEEDLK